MMLLGIVQAMIPASPPPQKRKYPLGREKGVGGDASGFG